VPSPRISAAIFVVVAGLALVAGRFSSAQRGPEAASRPPVRFAWPAGKAWFYAVRWDARSRRSTGLGQGDIAGRTVLDADASLRSMGSDATGETTLVFALESIRDYEVHLGQQDLLDDRDRELAMAALLHQEAFVHVDSRGVVASIAYHAETPSTIRKQLEALVQMMRVTLPADGAASWSAEEPTPNGNAHVRYENEGDAITRRRLSYDGLAALVGPGEEGQTLSSRATIRLDPSGVLGTIDDHEQLDAHGSTAVLSSTWTYTASLSKSGPFEPSAVHADDLDTGAGTPQDDRDRQRRQDTRLSRGLTLDAIEVELRVSGMGMKVDPTFVARAASFVRLHPESASDLLVALADPIMSDPSRQLIMDVLSSAGSDEAQDAMRRAFAIPVVKASPYLRAAIVQRFIFVTNPNPESARFVADLYARERDGGDAQVAMASAVTLGAVVEHLADNGATELSTRLDERLRADLSARRSTRMTTALLQALGNAHQAEDLEPVLAFAGDEHADVRERVARSLGRFDDPRAAQTLLGLARDESAPVEEATFRSLREQTLGDVEWDALAAAVEAGQTSPAADVQLVDLMARRADSGRAGQRILLSVLARTSDSTGDEDLRARIEQLLGRSDD
jgi:hypothetical protein